MSAQTEPQHTIITIDITPLVNGKRKVTLSGAPAHEMPVVVVGPFSDLHHLLDRTWIALQKREPQIVTVKEDKKATAQKPAAAKGENDAESEEAEEQASEPEGDQLVASEDAAPDPAPVKPPPPAALPVIENDPTASGTQTTFLEEPRNG